MTAFGFWVVAALSSQTSGLPWTRSERMGKSRRTARGSKGRMAKPRSGMRRSEVTEPGGSSSDSMVKGRRSVAGAWG